MEPVRNLIDLAEVLHCEISLHPEGLREYLQGLVVSMLSKPLAKPSVEPVKKRRYRRKREKKPEQETPVTPFVKQRRKRRAKKDSDPLSVAPIPESSVTST